MDDFKNYREEKYKIEIIKEFEDPDECGRAENYMIRDHMLLKDGLCLNRACCCGGEKVFSTVGIPGWNKGTHLSEEHKKKISRAHKGVPSPRKGIPWSEETRKKMSEVYKGIPSPRRIKISIEGTVFSSITEASKYYNKDKKTISRWLKTKKHNAKKT